MRLHKTFCQGKKRVHKPQDHQQAVIKLLETLYKTISKLKAVTSSIVMLVDSRDGGLF